MCSVCVYVCNLSCVCILQGRTLCTDPVEFVCEEDKRTTYGLSLLLACTLALDACLLPSFSLYVSLSLYTYITASFQMSFLLLWLRRSKNRLGMGGGVRMRGLVVRLMKILFVSVLEPVTVVFGSIHQSVSTAVSFICAVVGNISL